MAADYQHPPSFVNQNGTFEIGTWVRFTVDHPAWDGPTTGEIRHRDSGFYIRQPFAELPIGQGFVSEDSIRIDR